MAAPAEPQVWLAIGQIGSVILAALGVFFGVRYFDKKANRAREEEQARQLALAREQAKRTRATQAKFEQLTQATQEKVAAVTAAGEVERDQDPVERANEIIRQALQRNPRGGSSGPGPGGSDK